LARVPAAFYGLFITLVVCAVIFACGERSTGLAGNAGTTDAPKASPSSDASSPKPGEKAEKEEANVEAPAIRPETTEARPTPPPDDEATDEDLRIIPPEVVSGAYLTCVDASSYDAPPPPGYVYYGCSVLDADGERIDLSRVKSDFALRDPQGVEVKAAKVVVPDRDDDVIWQVLVEDFMRGVTGLLTVYDAEGKALTIAPETETYDTVMFEGGGFSFGVSAGRESQSSSARFSAE
jgi:hypothetical protein